MSDNFDDERVDWVSTFIIVAALIILFLLILIITIGICLWVR